MIVSIREHGHGLDTIFNVTMMKNALEIVFNENAVNLEVGTAEKFAVSYLIQSISMTVQKGNAENNIDLAGLFKKLFEDMTEVPTSIETKEQI